MIFVTLGSQKFQFNRLLREIDRLIKKGVVTEEVFAQTGYCDYQPKYFPCTQFLSRQEFDEKINAANIVVTHGGTGAIIGAVKRGRKVVAVPRLARYGEHVDDHQTQIIDIFEESNLIEGCRDIKKLGDALRAVREKTYSSYESNTQRIVDSIDHYISSL